MKDGKRVEASECPYCKYLNYEIFDIGHKTKCGHCKNEYYVEKKSPYGGYA